MRLRPKYHFQVADGFALTTHLYEDYLEANGLTGLLQTIFQDQGQDLLTTDLDKLGQISKEIIQKISQGHFTPQQEKEISEHYRLLSQKYQTSNLSVAIRSSAIAEDLPNASFAGQQDTFLNISGLAGDHGVLAYIKRCMASLFNVRAISYRMTHQISYQDVKISVAVQKMVRSDLGSAGVAFSLDPETGYDRAIIINSSYGLGELVVSGKIKPDEVLVFKPKLNDKNIPIIEKKIGQKNIKMIYGTNPGQKVETISLGKSYRNKICISDDNTTMLNSSWIKFIISS